MCTVGRFPGHCGVIDDLYDTPSMVYPGGSLSVLSVDLLQSKTGRNRTEHHTDRYQSDDLIVRRGQSFEIEIELSRAFNPNTDQLQLLLNLGSVPLSRGTFVSVPLVSGFQGNYWGAKIILQANNIITLSVISPSNAPIGQYELQIKTGGSIFKTESDIILLFNPWCRDDAVFLGNEDERKEYVLNDMGTIYMGNPYQIEERTWIFGQFNEGILAACLFLLKKSQAPASGWGDPVNITRVVSAIVNSNDDEGVLIGNWSGMYADGTSPSAWNSSVDILMQYHDKKVPVKYGQCWVFSGITTTVLRCLGIPTRSVTNFSSAHDTDNSLTTDVYVDENMRPIESLSTDSIWNFHVWNDCWMARPDLPSGMGGWQAVDATPQETSQGTFRCGPAPLSAIREGLVYVKYDAAFIFAEVNSDRIYWQKKPDGTFTQISCEKNVVGQKISTKAVGCYRREDITHLYKHPEGSEAERTAVKTASRYGSQPNTYSCAVDKDVTLNIEINKKELQIGQNAQLTIILKNRSSERRSIVLYLQVAVMYYTGVQKSIVQRDEISLSLRPNEERKHDHPLLYEKYKDQLVDQAALMLTATGQVTETKQVLATQFNFRLRTPGFIITPLGNAVLGRELAVKITFKNPLQQVLKNTVFIITGLGLLNTTRVSYGDIGSLMTINLTVKFKPTLPGSRKLLVSMDCQQLAKVHGVTDILVQ